MRQVDVISGMNSENQHICQGDHIYEKNRALPDIILLNTNYNDTSPPIGAPVSDDEPSFDSQLGHQSKESEKYVVSDNADYSLPDYPYPDSNIPSPSQTSPPNNSQEGDISREGDQSYPKHKYQRKQCPKSVWEKGSDEKMKLVELNN